MSSTDAVRRRRRERHAAAVVRAISGQPSADLRARRLRVNGEFVSTASPHLAVDLAEAPPAVARGVSDGLGLMLRHSDRVLHRQLAPDTPLERVIFDLAEQIRCEALAPPELAGVRHNLAAGFDEWVSRMQHDRVTDTGVGILIFTVAHMIRARLIRPIMDPFVDDLIETTRGNLAPLIGEALAALRAVIDDQQSFAFHAREIAEAVALVVGDSAVAPETASALERAKVLLGGWEDDDPAIHDVGDALVGGGVGRGDTERSLHELGDYHVFTRDFDREVRGVDLVPLVRCVSLRESLDNHRRAQSVSAARLAQRLRRQLARPAVNGWTFAEEDGQLDGSRLSQLVTDPTNHRVFKRERTEPTADVCVTFLVDTSGSMKVQRYQEMAVMLDTLAQALDLAGASCEVLGFTTGGWNGSQSMKAWRGAGAPSGPGRLNDLQHIVYTDADTTWRRSRRSLAAMLSTYHYREGVDGEALIWAYERLRGRPEARKFLVVISDGSPMDAATANNNREGFLDDHLHAVAGAIDQRGDIELGAIGLDGEVASVFRRSVALDLSATLSLSTYEVLGDLFG
ncbi:MAG: cobalt chelatase [Acidimicrobiaceae bacterium]|nr:cobalt chelatase [Acidimicrobiaceae bacterium]